ncbi:MAG: hypothetical protein LBT00_14780 [Spirochaetaceae bacterium]|jgi:hypothetical protein|nr:hypothetical protein [Spirochaetaceae bacterium]
MNSLQIVLLAGFLPLFSAPLFCANISVLVIETGSQDGKPVRRGGLAEVWETGLMDVLFEEGHIVTNAQAFALKKKPGKELTGEIKSYITEAEDLRIDYFVLVYLNYEADAGRLSDPQKPVDIEFNLFKINPARGAAQSAARGASKCIWTENVDLIDPKRGGYLARDEQTRARKAARSLIVHLGDTI